MIILVADLYVMGTELFWICGALSVLILCSFLIFSYLVRRSKVDHSKRLIGIENKISLQGRQIYIRTEHLDNYDFQRYNLSESLVVQWEIEL